MEKYLGNAYRGDPGVPHSGPIPFEDLWIGSFGFSAIAWFDPYWWKFTGQYNYHDMVMLFEHHHWRKAMQKGQPYEFEWNKLPRKIRDSYYYNWPDFFP